MNTNDKGRISELIAFAKFVSLGYTVLEPINKDGVYDCVIEKDGLFKKIQIKTIRETDSGKLLIPFRSTSHNRKGNTCKNYTKQDIDYFCGVYKNSVYLVPVGLRKSEMVLEIDGEYLI